MKFLRKLLGLETRGDGSWGELERLLTAASATAAGLSVSPESALRCPTVAASARILSESVSQLPLHLFRRLPEGGKERADDHPLAALVASAPNSWTTSAEWRGTAMMQLALHGEAFCWVGRARDRVVEIVNIPAGVISVSWSDSGEPSFTATTSSGTKRPVAREELLWLRLPGPNPHKPLSLVAEAREAIALSLAMEGYASRLFAKGARPSGVVKAPGKLTDQAIARLKASLTALHSGTESGGTAVFEEGMTFEALQFSSVDLQFLELRRHQIAEIARVFRIPLHLLQELERATHNNAEHMGQQFLSLVVLPLLALWRQALERDLLTEAERAEYFFEFETADLARADLAARFNAYAQAVTNGLLNPNEIRALENRPPYAGGDEFHRPLNTAATGQGQGAANG
ncbi:phage portal protein [Oceanibaculum indicum]|uniref:Portal protein-like protein n=1 Tax=Oceanibaculum indicum P24 TaxID=1207063 RepID=K2IYG6_9PROT|nr:phage portal protein [Oceanibaculum indicum]EKE75516.1 Portal protein-like protein [Oceanibaculum indicum P24]